MENNGGVIRSWALWLLYLERCGLSGASANKSVNESEDVSFCVLSDSPSPSTFAFLYCGHTSRIHLGTRHKNRTSTATYRIGAAACQLRWGCSSKNSRVRVDYHSIIRPTSAPHGGVSTMARTAQGPTCSQCCQDTNTDWHC